MSVKVKRERPDQRRHHRVTAPLFVTINGCRRRVDNWSLGGFKVSGLNAELPQPGQHLDIDVELPFQGFQIAFRQSVEIVRCDRDEAMVAGRFIELGEREAELMQHFIEDIVRGAMSSVDDTIQRIDVPVTPASLKPDGAPAHAVPVRRWPVRAMVMSSIYIVAGLAVIGYTGIVVFANYFNLEVRSAVISAPLEQVKAQADGRVRWTGFRPGDTIFEGDTVLRLFDNKVEREVDLARLAIEERSNEITYLMRRKVDEIERISAFADVATRDIEQAKLLQESLSAQVKSAQLVYLRTRRLHGDRYDGFIKVANAKRQLVALQKKLASQKVELRTRIKLAEKNLGKRHFTGNNLVGDLQSITAQIQRAEGALKLERQRYELARMQRERLAVKAPFTGTLLNLPHVNNGHVKAGETIALFERNGEREITAFLTQSEVLDVAYDTDAQIYVPATGEVAAARIVNIDRTMGFFKQASKRSPIRLQWREDKERTARVTLAFNDPEAFSRAKEYRAGLPVIVNFSRKYGGYVLARVRSFVNYAWSMAPPQPKISHVATGLIEGYRSNAKRLGETMRRRYARIAHVPKPVPAQRRQSTRLHTFAQSFKLRRTTSAKRPASEADPRPEL